MKKKIIIYDIIFTLIGCFFVEIWIYNSRVMFELIGNKEVNLNVNDQYKEEGYKALYHNKDITDKVIVNGEVDTSKIGSYSIKYQIKKSFRNIVIERIINVVDTKPPVITLNGSYNVTMYIDDQYKELGYEVSDNYD